MELKLYLDGSRGRASALSRLLRVSATTVSEWATEKKQVPAERCPEIERSTFGQVTCEELRPDLAEQWAYLRNSANPTQKAA
jgi:DNA-binding transcriptional regulator YdaS (Cro superfamily)